MNDGGEETCDVVQVRLISLPLLMKSSGFPRILAFETVSDGGVTRKKGAEKNMSERVASGIIYVENNPSGSDVWEGCTR